jgi:hypothetical protein
MSTCLQEQMWPTPLLVGLREVSENNLEFKRTQKFIDNYYLLTHECNERF